MISSGSDRLRPQCLRPGKVDPVAGAIVQRLITNAAREMGLTLLRSTRSPVLFEARDFSTGIFDAAGRVLEQHKYLPMHAFLLAPAIASMSWMTISGTRIFSWISANVSSDRMPARYR